MPILVAWMADVGEQGVDLQAQEIGGRYMHTGHGLRILRGQCRDHAAAVGAERGEGLDVGEDACTAGWVDAGDGDDVRDAGRLRRRSGRRAACGSSG